MPRVFLALILVCLCVSPAVAKDLCIQIDTGAESGAVIVLKKVQLGKGKVGPVQGYYAGFDQTFLTFTAFFPLSGGTIVATHGGLVAGMTLHRVHITGSGNLVAQALTRSINMHCSTGPDGKIGVPDSCGGVLDSTLFDAHVVDCKEAAPAIPPPTA